MLDDVYRPQFRERIVGKGVRELIELAKHVGTGVRIAVDTDCARVLVDAAANVEGHRIFILGCSDRVEGTAVR